MHNCKQVFWNSLRYGNATSAGWKIFNWTATNAAERLVYVTLGAPADRVQASCAGLLLSLSARLPVTYLARELSRATDTDSRRRLRSVSICRSRKFHQRRVIIGDRIYGVVAVHVRLDVITSPYSVIM